VTTPGPEARPLETLLKAQAFGLGFDLAGVSTLGPVSTHEPFTRWLGAGYAGEMRYLARGAELRADTRHPVPGMRSAVVVALNYDGTQPEGSVARYARGDDYHRIMWDKLDHLGRWLHARTGAATRAFVDTGPVLERDLARRAGLGWFGKNTMLIHPTLGSYFFIGALFCDLELVADPPFEDEHCGTCTRCLDACPTQAFAAPRVLDATRCISYLTIELKGAIPESLRPAVDDHLYGCDVCQEVCPWNQKFSRPLTEMALRAAPDRVRPDLPALLALDAAEWKRRFGASAITRAKRRGLARNAAVVLGNHGTAEALPVLEHAAAHDPEPLVREHATWAVAQVRARNVLT
jgi:epoxyqueuosine reductase